MKKHTKHVKRKDPLWGVCEVCKHKDLLSIRGDSNCLCLMCNKCCVDEDNANIIWKTMAKAG